MKHVVKNCKKTSMVLVAVFTAVYLFANFGYNSVAAATLLPQDDITEATGANVNESSITRILYVDANHINASDLNDGTSENYPLKTISRAAALAINYKRSGQGTKVIIKPGIYRENITIDSGNNETPLVFEGTDKGQVIISGSEVYGNWQVSGQYYTHAWNYNWGASPNIYLDDYGLDIPEIVRRREMVFINGQRLDQVMTKSEVTAGKYYVSEAEDKIYMIPPAGVDMSSSTVEVAIRDHLFELFNMRNVVLRNMTITHGNPFHTGAPVTLWQCRDILIEDADISHNNWFGIGVWNSRDITFNRSSLSNNGGGGIQGSGNTNILLMDSETSHNNWRGNYGNYHDWDTAGIKILFTSIVKFLRHKANGNYAPGLWTDSDCRDIIIEDCMVTGNTSQTNSVVAGIYLEGGIGPYRIIGTKITDNRRGINIASANDVHIINSIIANNQTCQINVFNNWNYGREFSGVTSFCKNTRIESTIIAANVGNTHPLFDYDHGDLEGYKYWIDNNPVPNRPATQGNGLRTANMRYYHPKASQAFLLKDAVARGNLNAWQANTELDSDALWLSQPCEESVLWTWNYYPEYYGAAYASNPSLIERVVMDNNPNELKAPVDDGVKYNGVPSLRINIMGSVDWWFASGYIIPQINLTDFPEVSYLQFAVKGESGGEQFNIGFYIDDSNASYYTVTSVTTDWQIVNVPLSYFINDGITAPNMIRLQYVNGQPMKVWVSDIKIIGVSEEPGDPGDPGDIAQWSWDYYPEYYGAAYASNPDLIERVVMDNNPNELKVPVDNNVKFNDVPSLRINIMGSVSWWFASGYIIPQINLTNFPEGSYLQFAVKGESGGEQFNIGFYINDSNASYYTVTSVTTDWQILSVPLSYFINDGITVPNMVRFQYVNGQPMKVWVSDIKIVEAD